MSKSPQIKFLFAVLLWSCVGGFAFSRDRDLAQSIMTIWTDREGLPSNSILDVVQDRDGYIWLASYDGLVRFDGERFTVFTQKNGGFDGRSARTLELAPDGTLWIGSNAAGLYSYRDGVFRRYGLDEGLPDLSVRAIAVDSSGALWVGTARGVSRRQGDRFEPALPPGGPELGITNFLLPLADGSILVGSNLTGLWQIAGRRALPYLEGEGLQKASYSAGLLDGIGQLWLGTTSGRILRISRNQVRETIEPEGLAGSSVNDFHQDSEGTLWIATDRGIVSLNGGDSAVFNEACGLPSNVVSGLLKDREGNLWASTERGGLVKFTPGKFVNTDKKDGLVSDAVNGITEDRHRSLWVATDEGVSFFPSESDPYSTDRTRRKSVDALVESLRGARVRQIRGEKDGSLWFSTYSEKALLIFDADGSTRSISAKDGLPTNRVRFSYRTKNGDVWIGTTSGPVRIDSAGMTAFGPRSELPNLFILCAGEDAEGRLWLGTDGGGVAVYDGRGFKTYTKDDGVAGNIVFRAFTDSGGRTWLCTSEGLTLFAGGRMYGADAALGLAGDGVYETLEDPSGNLWILTGRRAIVAAAEELAAAVQQNRAAADVRVYDRLDGLAGQLSANAWGYVNANGIVYIPTLQGVSTFNPQAVQRNSLPPPVLIERLEGDGKELPIADGGTAVGPGVKRLTLQYTALSFMIPQRVAFEYMLEGYDREWISNGTRREISYTNLPPGSYVFRIRAQNNDGVVNEAGASLAVKKKPFFHQTPWFYALIAGALVLSGFLIAYLRVLRLKRRAEELNRTVEERTRELALEKDKSESLLLNILPPAVADELKETGAARPQVYGKASVLFADIVDFTSWSAGRRPDAIIAVLNEVFTAFDDILGGHGCERIKTLGDGYLACCGLPEPAEDHAARLVKAALDMLRYAEKRNAAGAERVRIRIGIDSGPIVGGVVGVKKYIYDVFGDTVNMAFRLEPLSTPMGLTVSERTAQLVKSEFPLLRRPAREVKGFGKTVSYYVCRNGAGTDYRQSLETLKRAEALLADGRKPDCLAALDTLDPTAVEPEVYAKMNSLRKAALTAR